MNSDGATGSVSLAACSARGRWYCDVDFEVRIRDIWRKRWKGLCLHDRFHCRVINSRVAGTLFDLDELSVPVCIEPKLYGHRLRGSCTILSG